MTPLLIPVISNLIDRILPDKKAADEAKLKMLELQQAGELASMTAQTEINKVEAASTNWFVSGGRPFIMWVCGFGCAWNWVGLPIATFFLALFGTQVDIRPADISEMLPVLLGLLGLGGLRTYEKRSGVARN